MAEQIGLSAVMDMSDFNRGMSQYLSGIDKMNGQTGSFAGAATAHFQSFGKAVLGATAVMGGAMVAAAGAATVAVGKFTIDGIKSAANLEEKMSAIAATLGMTAEQAKPLKDTISQLAIDPTLVVTADEAAEAVENLAKNGLNMQQIVDGTAKSVVLLANATGADFGDAADAVTDIMAQFNKEAKDTPEIINGIVGVTNASKMSFDDYRLAIGQAGGVAASMGVDLDDFNTALAATAPLFNSGSDAGTGFKSFLNSLIPTTKEQKKAFKELGLNFYDNAGQMKDMSVIAEELNDKLFEEVTFTREVSNMTGEDAAKKKLLEQAIARTNRELYKYEIGLNGVAQSEDQKRVSIDRLNREHDAAIAAYQGLAGAQGTTITTTRKLTQEERNRFLELAFGVDGSRAAIALAEAGAVVYTDMAVAAKELGVSQEELNKYMEGGITGFEAYEIAVKKADAVEQARIRTDNFKGALGALASQIEGVQLLIGDNFLPMLTELTRWFSQMVTQYSPAIIAAFAELANAIPAVIGVLTSLIQNGELLSAVEFGVTGSTAEMIDGFFDFVFAITDTISAIQSFLQPITDAVASFVSWQDVMVTLGLAVASVVIPAIWGAITALAPVIAVVGAVLLAVSAMRMAWESNFLGIQDIVAGAVAYIQANWQPFVASIMEMANGAIAFVSEHFYVLAGALAGVGIVLAGVQLAAWWGAISAAVTAAWPVIVAAIAAINWPLIALGATMALLGAAWAGNWFGIQEKTATAINYILTTLEPFTSAISQHMSGALTEVKNWALGNETEFTHVQAIWDGAKTSGQALFGDLTNFITTYFPIWQATLTNWGISAWQWIIDAIPIVTQKLTEWYTVISGYVSANLPIWIATLTAWGYAAWAWIVAATGQVTAKLGEWWAAILGYVVSNLPIWMATLANWGIIAWQWIVDAAGIVGGKLGEWWTVISGYVSQQLSAWRQKMTEWAVAAWAWILSAIAALPSKLVMWWGVIKAFMDEQRKTLLSTMLTWATALVEWIGDKAANALPELGKWLGKIVAWTVIGAIAIAAATVKFGASLLSWIATAITELPTKLAEWVNAIGTWVTTKGETSFADKVKGLATAFWSWLTVDDATVTGKFKTLLGAIERTIGVIGEGLVGFASGFAQSFLDTLTGAAEQAGVKIDFSTVGKTILDNITNGWPTDFTAYLKKFTDMLKSGWDALTDASEWKKAGVAIIDGVIAGFDSVKDKIAGWITDHIPSWFKDMMDGLQAHSPSRLFIPAGQAIIGGVIVGIEDYATKLDRALYNAGANTYSSFWDGAKFAQSQYRRDVFQGFPWLGRAKIEDFPSDLQRITSLLNGFTSAANTFVEMSGNFKAGVMMADTEKTTGFLNAQLELLNQIEALGIDPNRVLQGQKLGIYADANKLAEITASLANLARNKLAEEVQRRQTNILANQVLKPFTTWLGEQTKLLQGALERTVTEFSQIRVDRLVSKVSDLDKKINAYLGVGTPLNSYDQFKLSELLTQRADLISQIEAIGSMEDLFAINEEKRTMDLMKKQVDLLTQAKELGLDIQSDAFGDINSDRTLSALTAVLGNIQHAQAWQLKQQLDLLRNPKTDPQAERLKVLEEQQASLDAQVELMGKLRTLGLQISGEYNFGLGMTQGDLRNLQIRLNETQLQRTLNEIKLMERLSPELLNPTATSTGAQLFKAQVLDPMLKTLRETVMLEGDRVKLIEKYRIEASKLATIENKERQLEFLRQQNDMLNMIDDEFPGYIEAQIIAGTKFGLDANIDDLLAVADRMTKALIQKVKEDMGIASPSKVFMRIGQNVMEGFSKGIRSLAAQPIDAMRQTLRPLPYAMSGRALTMNMGGVTINNGMDESMFTARVRSVVEGMI